MAAFVRKELGHVKIDLLPYNKFGEVKYDHLGIGEMRPSGETQGE